MDILKEKLMDELLNQLFCAAKEIAEGNAGNWDCEEGSAPEWVLRVLAAAKDLFDNGKTMEGAELVAALCEDAKSTTAVNRLCTISTAMLFLGGKKPLAGWGGGIQGTEP